MQADVPIRKPGGRLSREDQRRLGDILQRVYDDVVRQGVPDRFKDLLNELDDQSAAQADADTGVPSPGHSDGEPSSKSEHVVEANPGSKGSH